LEKAGIEGSDVHRPGRLPGQGWGDPEDRLLGV